MEQPQGYEESDRKWYVCTLFKSLYGLKQAGRKWYDALCKALDNIGFKQTDTNPAVFYAHNNNNIAILCCHVNDCMITGNSQQLIQGYKDKLKQKYSLTDLGPANWLLGIKINRDLERQTISLSRLSYINSILMHFNFTNLNTYGPLNSVLKRSMPTNNGRNGRNEGGTIP